MYCSVIIFSRPLDPLSYELTVPASVGTIVQVPLNRQSYTGIITEISDEKPAYNGRIRKVLEIVDPKPFISEALMNTLRFMSAYYQAPLSFCLKLAMPGGMMRAGTCRYFPGILPDNQPSVPSCDDTNHADSWLFAPQIPSDKPTIVQIFERLEQSPNGLTETELKKLFKIENEQFSTWIEDGTLVPHWSLDQKRQEESTEKMYEISQGIDPPKRFGKKQEEIYNFIQDSDEPVRHSALLKQFGSCTAVLGRLLELGLITVHTTTKDKTSFDDIVPTYHPVERTDEQEEAIQTIIHHDGFGSFLLFGVTGSGKTEVYLGVMEAVRSQNKGCIFVLPEIALTPQFCAVFKGKFGNDVAVLHSGLSEHERFDTWSRIRSGHIGIAIGPRSALFAPVQNLGLIVIDEEHDGSFKQGETPRYHARDMALYLGQQSHCPVILGSATPSIESYSRALQGKSKLLMLTRRPMARPMPDIQIIDMRNRPKPEFPDDMDDAEKKRLETRNRLISNELISELQQTLDRHEQAIIFLNRRGFSTFIQCEYCGHVLYCPNCDVALTYYKYSNQLHCHYCDYVDQSNGICPKCGRQEMNYTGYGTERLVDILQRELPNARIDRLDRDRATTRNIQNVLGAFKNGELDILVGTQMVAKGHDIHNVTLVGIINADMGLHMPDFRSSERTYQLLAQVSGRAGRGDRPGRVILQTLKPDHPAIHGIVERDYASFANQELEIRRALINPPFSFIIMFLMESPNYADVERYANTMASAARGLQRDLSSSRVLGPAPAPISMAKGLARYQLFLRHENRSALHRWLNEILMRTQDFRQKNENLVKLIIDVDPFEML